MTVRPQTSFVLSPYQLCTTCSIGLMRNMFKVTMVNHSLMSQISTELLLWDRSFSRPQECNNETWSPCLQDVYRTFTRLSPESTVSAAKGARDGYFRSMICSWCVSVRAQQKYCINQGLKDNWNLWENKGHDRRVLGRQDKYKGLDVTESRGI